MTGPGATPFFRRGEERRGSEGPDLHQLLYGRKGRRYRIIYAIDEDNRIVTVLYIRHGARDAFQPDDPDDDERIQHRVGRSTSDG